MLQFKTIEMVADGKTKKVWATDQLGIALFESKNALTAGDGAKQDFVPGKDVFATQTTCNVFRFLDLCGLPTSFINQVDKISFIGKLCAMIPYEVVVRREAYGSYLKCYPYLKKGHVFQRLVVQFFLKTNGKKWRGTKLPVDDPLVIFDDGRALLYRPDQSIDGQEPFLALDNFPLNDSLKVFDEMASIATKTFLALEKAWQQVEGNYRLIDFKVEFGFDADKKLRLADVIDSDSWRVVKLDGEHLDKQSYRDGAALDVVLEKYRVAAELTSQFRLPTQQIIIWSGSVKDDVTSIEHAIMYDFGQNNCRIEKVVLSMHKQPIKGCSDIVNLVRAVPDSVVIAYVGMSNGAGPILSTQLSVPVITIPANYKVFPDDVWSSLRTPSNTPVMTVLGVQNAVLAALQILAMKNPKIYMQLRSLQEERLSNNLIL